MGSWARCFAPSAVVTLALALALPSAAAGVVAPKKPELPPGWDKLPSPEGEQWVPPLPPPPPKKEAARPDAKPQVAGKKKHRMTQAGRGLRISGIVITSLGLASGVVTLVAFMQAQKARRELEKWAAPQFDSRLREEPLAEIAKWNPITVATGIAAGAAGAVGISLLVAGIVRGYKGPRDQHNAWVAPMRRGAIVGWSF